MYWTKKQFQIIRYYSIDNNPGVPSVYKTGPLISPAAITKIEKSIKIDMAASQKTLGVSDMCRINQVDEAKAKANYEFLANSGRYEKEQILQNAKSVLSTRDFDAVNRLPAAIKSKVLTDHIDYGKTSKTKLEAQIISNLQTSIAKMIPNSQKDQTESIYFANKDNGRWTITDCSSLYNVVNKMPAAHRTQLAGIAFIKDDMPSIGKNATLFAKIAMTVESGEYIANGDDRKIILYDRGSDESLGLINQDILESIDKIRQGSKSEVRSLQTIVNLYGESKGKKYNLSVDGSFGPKTKAAVMDFQLDYAKKIIDKQLNTFNPNSPVISANGSVPVLITKVETMSKIMEMSINDKINKVLDDIKTGKIKPEDIGSVIKTQALFPDELLVNEKIQTLLFNIASGNFDNTSFNMFMEELMTAVNNKGGTLSENVLAHEIGHSMQLSGSDFDTKLVGEFAKLSNWENADGTLADGHTMGQFALEDRFDALKNVVSDGKKDAGLYLHGRNDNFASKYAKTDPTDDFAESYRLFIFDPAHLMSVSPEKFLYINAISRVQMGSNQYMLGDPTKDAYYKPDQIMGIAQKAVVSTAKLEQALQNLVGHGELQNKLLPDTETAILESHKDLLPKVGFKVGATLDLSSPDNKVMSRINSYASMLSNLDRQAIDKTMDFYRKVTNDPATTIGKDEWNKLSPKVQEKLKDKSYVSMLYAIGKISGNVWVYQNARIKENQDQADYKKGGEYLKENFLKKPKVTMDGVKSVYAKAREVASKIYNPEQAELDYTSEFFNLLKKDPKKAIGAEIWNNLPENFKNKLKDPSFIDSITGYEGQFLVSYRSIQDAAGADWEKEQVRKALEDMFT